MDEMLVNRMLSDIYKGDVTFSQLIKFCLYPVKIEMLVKIRLIIKST